MCAKQDLLIFHSYLNKFRCRENFDFSDHIVLFITHYFVPCSLEISAILIKIRCQLPYQFSSQLFGILNNSIPLLISFLLIFINIRLMLNTATYFHTVHENLFALLLTTVFIGLPLYLFANTRFWCACVFGATFKKQKNDLVNENINTTNNKE